VRTHTTIEEAFDQDVLASELPVVVDFGAPWCGPCLAVGPLLDRTAAERAGQLKVVKVNVDEEPGLAARFAITSIPTLVRFQAGAPVARVVGSFAKSDLERALGLDPIDASVETSKRRRGLLTRLGLRS
jgi:thioredoxin